MQDAKYFSHSWKLLTRDKGWVKPILVLAIAMFVPVVGPLAVLGYALEWARLSAWGVDAAPKQRGVKIGGCLVAGWRAFVVILVWMLLWSVATSVVTAIIAALRIRLLSSLLSLAIAVANLLLSLVVMVAALRATIYQKIGAGLSFVRVYEMVSHDAAGLFKNVAIPLVTMLIVGGICTVSGLLVMSLAMPDILRLVYEVEYLSATSGSDPSDLLAIVGSILRTVMPASVLIGYVSLVFSVAGNLLLTNSIGLWMRQFNVGAWGSPSDPLPVTPAPLPPASSASTPAPQSQPQPHSTAEPVTPAPTPAQPRTDPAPVVAPQPRERSTSPDGETVVPLTPHRAATDELGQGTDKE